ncbi:MAG TPA: glycoside hydrolase family 3 C-terminal domain-containing protein [Acidobacteriaceae bacterium]|jgi:beta-glucosidase|nr:glycoside hydrolase family 3 C-terminal domain-containing protein [Acidobacteriaceae bacterium]
MSRRSLLLASCALLYALALAPIAASAQNTTEANQQFPWMNPGIPIDHRVDLLISRMTLEEKVGQMQDHAPAIPRLGVPKYDWWNEGLHGVAFAGTATNFPQVIGMAATFDTQLVHTMGIIDSTEARAKYDQAIRNNQHEQFFGLTFWAPNVNIFRDPRWGRGQETYGEDPFLTGRMAVAFVTGMQGDDPNLFRVVSTPKHYAVHSGPESTRHQANVDVSPHDLEDTYLPAFRAAVTEAHAQSVMCAYNAIDGAPACANKMLLQQHLRDDWHFNGYVVSDCAAVADINTGHHYAPDMAHAAADAVKAGTDLECRYQQGWAFPSLVDAVHQGLVSEADINTAVHRLFRARFELGMFDPPSSYTYGHIPFSVVNSPEHRRESLQAARESIVLLKNEDHILPLQSSVKSIAVIGPTAELVQSLQGNYNGPPPNPVYPIEGIEKRFSSAQIHYAQGSTLVEGFPIPIEHSALHPESGSGDGLTGAYYNSTDLSGSPVLTRTDRNINFNWDKVVPVPGLERNNFSVRWSGTFTPPGPGDYKLGVRINYCYACENAEGFRLYLDGKLLLSSENQKTGERGGGSEATVHFTDTTPHPIRLEYLHGTGSAGIDLAWQPPVDILRNQAIEAAQQSDVVIACVGLSPNLEGEEMPVHLDGFSGGDRTAIALPAVQEDLLKAVAATGKPLIVVLQNGSALAVNWSADHAKAILEAWYPGEEGGTAIAETLAGDNNPAGRLPLTFYASLDQLPPFADYSMQNRTYRYFTGKPLYPFGYGLSYTTFAYSDVKLPHEVHAGDPVAVTAEVKNTGNRAGDEVVELYLTQPRAYETPSRELAAFKRIHLAAGATAHVGLTIEPRSLGQVDEQGNRIILPGDYAVSVGSGQPGDAPDVQSATFTITGKKELPK